MSFNRSIVTYFVAIAALMFGACGAKQDGPSEEAVAVAERSSCSLESLRGLPAFCTSNRVWFARTKLH